MPPLCEPHVAQLSMSHQASSTSAHKDDFRDTEELRAAVREALTNFVTDTMYDKPDDVLQYMAQWARKQREEKGKQCGGAVGNSAPRTSAASRSASHSVSSEPARCTQTPENDHAEELDDTANQIMSLAKRREQHLHDKAEGCQDHYLMALEDSDGDIFHINQLQKKMAASRKAELDAKADTAAASAKLKEIAENDEPEAAKAKKRAELLDAYKRMWENDLPKGHLN